MGNTHTMFLCKLLSLTRGHKWLFHVLGKALSDDSPRLFRHLARVCQIGGFATSH